VELGLGWDILGSIDVLRYKLFAWLAARNDGIFSGGLEVVPHIRSRASESEKSSYAEVLPESAGEKLMRLKA
jgi:hypothetical protein